MTGRESRWKEARELFDRAVELPIEERQAWVSQQCVGDSELESLVSGMLRHADDPEFLEPPDPSAIAPSEPEPPPRLGEFVLEERIGHGSMGVVYRAHQDSLNRTVALKVIRSDVGTSSDSIERFHRESRLAARLNHPHVVQLLADGQEGSVHWFAMDLVDGLDLGAELENRRADQPTVLPTLDSPDAMTAIAELVADIAEALDHAHRQGVVHRDVKPSNILIAHGQAGWRRAKLVDFGIARDNSLGTLTRSHQVLGSPHYMSPEQARIVRHPVDQRTDIYSLGVVLYELLGAKRPYESNDSMELLAQIRRAEPTALRSLNGRVPRDLATICGKAMRKSPDARYQSAQAMAEDLRRFLRHEAIQARPPGRFERAVTKLTRHKVSVGIGLAVGIALPGGIWVESVRAASSREQRAIDRANDLLARSDWDSITPTELNARRAEILAADPSSSTARSLEARFRRYEATLRQRSAEQFRAAWSSTDLAPGRSLDIEQTLQGIRDVARHAELFGGDAQRLEAPIVWPWLTVTVRDGTGQVADAEIRLQPLDAVRGDPDGPASNLGPSPITERRVPPGYARIQVFPRDGRKPAEFTRLLEIGREVRLDLQLAEPEANSDMVQFEGGTFTYDPTDLTSGEPQGWTLAPFLLDRHEVSVGDYRRFVQTMGNEFLPLCWTGEETPFPGPEYDQLPVTGVSWEQARAYAEWTGKRLPSIGEWSWAARSGNSQLKFPWSSGSWPDCYAVELKMNTRTLNAAGTYYAYMQPIDSGAAGRTSTGLHWMLGNASEWTESLMVEANTPGPPRVLTNSRFVAGHAFNARHENFPLDWVHKRDVGPLNGSRLIGFRCAQTVFD